MPILDQYGQPTRMRFAQAINRNRSTGPVFSQRDASIHKLINSSDRKSLAALSRRVVFNHGVAKETIRQKAAFTVGGAFRPSYTGEDAEAGDLAEAYLEEVFFPNLELSGGTFEWQDFLEMLSKGIDRDGEVFVMLTHHENGDPALLAIPAYMVRSQSDSAINGGEDDGARMQDGLILDPSTGRVRKYRVWTDDTNYKDIPAGDMVHLFERDFPEQKRGFPAFAHALSDILNGMESKQLEVLRQLLCSNVFLINKGGPAPRSADAGFELLTDSTNQEAVLSETVSPGIKYLRSDESLEMFSQQTPGDVWSSFQERLNNEAVVGAGWSKSMVSIGSGNSQGTVERADVERARLAVKSRSRTLKRGGRAFVTWAMTGEDAPAIQRFNGWTFSDPARLSVDDGREDRARLEAVKAGLLSEEAYQADHGRTLRQHYVSKAKALQLAQQIAEEYDVDASELKSDDRPASEGGSPDMKNLLDAYGVAVRAGTITPQPDDEDHFRDLAGLPSLSEEARDLWELQGRTRQPITLVQEGAESSPTAFEEDTKDNE